MPLIQQTRNGETGLGLRPTDKGQHGPQRTQRVASPIGTDMVEQAMFHRVPLRCSRRIVADGDFQPVLIGPTLQFSLPQPKTAAIAAARVGGNQQPLRLGKPATASGSPPTANRRHGERRRVSRGSYTHMPFVVLLVVDSVGDGPACCVLRKVVSVDVVCLPAPALAGILKIADQLLFLRIHADSRISGAFERFLLLLNIAELAVPIWVRRTRETFFIHSGRKPPFAQQSSHRVMTDSPPQSLAEVPLAATHPFAAGDGMSAGFALGQSDQLLLNGGSFFSTGIRPPPGRRTRSAGRFVSSASNSSRPRRMVCTCIPVTNDI